MLNIIVRYSWILALLLAACDKQVKSPPEVILNPQPATIDYNGTVTMSWDATEVDYCFATGDWTGNLKTSGSKILGPLTRDSLYLLSCFYAGNEISNSVTVKVRAPQIPRISLSASPLSIAFGGSTTITWSSKYVTDCRAAGDWSGQKELNGSYNFEGLENDSEFRLICTGPQGEVSESVSVNVYEQGITVPQVSLTASPAKVTYNGSTTLSWNTQNADICRASGKWFGSKARNGTETISRLNKDSHFILRCSIAGGGGGEGVDTVKVRVDPAPSANVTLTASSSMVAINGSTTLRWSSSHADSCIAIGDWSGTRSISGTHTISNLQKDSVFSLNCEGIGGLGSDSITVTLTDDNSDGDG